MIDAAELELFQRSVRQATERHTGEALDEALVELGWPDALAVDPQAAIAILFPLQGEAVVTSSGLDQVVATALGVEVPAAVVLPPLGQWSPPGTVTGAHMSVRGLATRAAGEREHVVVASSDGTVASVAITDLDVRPVTGIDPDFGLVEVTADAAAVAARIDAPGDAWTNAVVLAQLALSYELVGVARGMLALAREHAIDRVQFGQTISHFQALRHRLAETLVAIEGADGVIGAATAEPSPELAAVAKALAGRSALTAAKHCQQVLAGIGFTTEHPFHLAFRRAVLLDQLFGSTHALTRALGEDLLGARRLSPTLSL